MLRKFGLWKDANISITFTEESSTNGTPQDLSNDHNQVCYLLSIHLFSLICCEIVTR